MDTNSQAFRRALIRVTKDNPDSSEEELLELAKDLVYEWEADAAQEREFYGEPEDTPSIQSADLWCTGEGQHHGVI